MPGARLTCRGFGAGGGYQSHAPVHSATWPPSFSAWTIPSLCHEHPESGRGTQTALSTRACAGRGARVIGRGLTDGRTDCDHSHAVVANSSLQPITARGPTDYFYSLSWRHDKENETIRRTPFIANSRVSCLGLEEGKKNQFFPHFELINRTRGRAANMLVLRKAVLKQN